MITTVNPANLKEISTYEYMSDIDKRLDLADAMFKKWRLLSLHERATKLLLISNELKKNIEDLSDLMNQEMGKTINEARAEVEKCCWLIEEYCRNDNLWPKQETLTADGKKHFIDYEPLGVIYGIMPWNFPLWQVIRFAIPTLLVGNTILMKHADNVSGTSLKIDNIIKRCIGDGVFQSLIISHEQSNKMLRDLRIKGVSLTGSTRAGSEVASVAGKTIKKCVFELGGSDPFIVFDDANIEEAAKQACQSRLLNSGQSCIAAKRFIIHSKIYDKFIETIISHIENWKEFAPLVHERAKNDLQELVDDAISKGAERKYVHDLKKSTGYYFNPLILTNLNSNMRIYHEEAFGPVFQIYQFDDDLKAIELANDTVYGLSCSVWTNSSKTWQKIYQKLDFGSIFVNQFSKSDPRLPFGGIKQSGIGREIGSLGIKEFTNAKVINIYDV